MRRRVALGDSGYKLVVPSFEPVFTNVTERGNVSVCTRWCKRLKDPTVGADLQMQIPLFTSAPRHCMQKYSNILARQTALIEPHITQSVGHGAGQICGYGVDSLFVDLIHSR